MNPFRFGVIAAPRGSGADWLATARRVESLGFDTLLAPDVTQLHAPLPALAAAAVAAPTLSVGTFVVAAPLRPPRMLAWEAYSLSQLTGGRFELGIGTGRENSRPEIEAFGLPWGTAADRRALVRDAVTELRALAGHGAAGDHRTPVLMAAAGPRAISLAAELADIVAVATPPLASRAVVAETIQSLRDQAAGRALELAMNLFVVGTDVPAYASRIVGVDPATIDEHETVGVLRGSPTAMAEELQRRRETLGVSYFVAELSFIEAMAPVVAQLSSR